MYRLLISVLNSGLVMSNPSPFDTVLTTPSFYHAQDTTTIYDYLLLSIDS